MTDVLAIMQHTIGVDQYGRGEHFRNHFVTGAGSDDYPACCALVNYGLMGVRKKHPLAGGDDCFWLTDAGKQYVAQHSPRPPKLSRGKQRYLRYLEYGDGGCFLEYLKWDADKSRSWNGGI